MAEICQQHLKGGIQCSSIAAFRYTWPGKDESFICKECVKRLQAIADAMGLYIQIREVE